MVQEPPDHCRPCGEYPGRGRQAIHRPVALRNINRKDLLWGLFPLPLSNRQTSRLDFDAAPKSDVALDLAGTFFGFGIIPGCA